MSEKFQKAELLLDTITLLLCNSIFVRNPKEKNNASSGNRTRAARVAGEHSTTEPTMLC